MDLTTRYFATFIVEKENLAVAVFRVSAELEVKYYYENGTVALE